MTDQQNFVGVRIEGGLLPADLLTRLATSSGLDGMSSADYHLAAGETVREAANRVWSYLRGVWTAYQDQLTRLPEGDLATTLTRDRWLQVLLAQLGYGRVPTTPAGGIDADGQSFPVSHQWECVPIHLLGAGVALDKRTKGVAGAAEASPQSMLQELLNRSDRHVWGILSNGSTLRLLRDSTSLVGSAYVEFDLEAIFDGDLFSDFLLLFTLCQESRLEVRDDDQGPSSCWLETWRVTELESGTRALDHLRDGVIEALEILGRGFLTHRDNADLRDAVAGGEVSMDDVNHALLRVIYRLLFTFVAEDRDMLLDPKAPAATRQRYVDYFSTARLRHVARRRSGGHHGDKWRALRVVWDGLGSTDGRPELALTGIGGLFEHGELDLFTDCELSNEALLRAVRTLSVTREAGSGIARNVDYRNLGAEELGSIYESLLEYVPHWDAAAGEYTLRLNAGNARKTSGSYYTPTPLIESLLDSALEPALDQAQKNADDPEAALLTVTVCDPACGSGHFLVGAARRIAKRVAALRSGDPEPSPDAVREAMRDVVGRCIYGVDVNPLAAELAKVSLWLEAIEPGKPLTFLDAQIKVGNALLGVTPSLLADGLPDAAFKPIEGDDKAIAKELAKQNRAERVGQGSLFDNEDLAIDNRALAEVADALGGPAPSLADVHVQQQRMRAYLDSTGYRAARRVADAWCSAFMWHKTADAPPAVSHATLVALEADPASVPEATRDEIVRLTAQYRFFHWHVEFPHIFPTGPPEISGVNPETGWYGGFDVVVGNPPWERVKLQEQEFFATRDPEIAQAPNAAERKRLIRDLATSNPALHREFLAELRKSEGVSHLLRNSGRYPLAGRGDINTYAVFSEGDRSLLGERGRMGIIVPTGIATDATTQHFFRNLVETRSLASLYDFENARPIFGGVHRSFKFCLLTTAGRGVAEHAAEFAFFVHDAADLQRPSVRFELTPEEIALLNPNTRTCPVFRTRRDAEITLGIYRRVPVLINDNDPVNGNPWGIKFMRMFDMSNDSKLFRTREQLEDDGWTLDGNIFKRGDDEMLPLYEAKMIHHYDHRWATYERDGKIRDVTAEEKRDPGFVVMPRYWVPKKDVDDRLSGKWDHDWLLGYRWIARSTDERTVISARFPRSGVGNSLPVVLPARGAQGMDSLLNSFCVDYSARQKLGGANMTFGTFAQLPIESTRLKGAAQWSDGESIAAWLESRARHPRTFDVHSEVDAGVFHVYGVARDDVDYIMETFPIVKRKDIDAHGEYRTKRMILEVYDQMAEAIRTGVPYESPLDEELG